VSCCGSSSCRSRRRHPRRRAHRHGVSVDRDDRRGSERRARRLHFPRRGDGGRHLISRRHSRRAARTAPEHCSDSASAGSSGGRGDASLVLLVIRVLRAPDGSRGRRLEELHRVRSVVEIVRSKSSGARRCRWSDGCIWGRCLSSRDHAGDIDLYVEYTARVYGHPEAAAIANPTAFSLRRGA